MLQAVTAITSYDVIVTENQVNIISILLLSAIFAKRLVNVYKFHLQNYMIGASLLCIRIRIPKSDIPLCSLSANICTSSDQ